MYARDVIGEMILVHIDELLREQSRTFYWLSKETGVVIQLWAFEKQTKRTASRSIRWRVFVSASLPTWWTFLHSPREKKSNDDEYASEVLTHQRTSPEFPKVANSFSFLYGY